jgi:hypothetical protein
MNETGSVPALVIHYRSVNQQEKKFNELTAQLNEMLLYRRMG